MFHDKDDSNGKAHISGNEIRVSFAEDGFAKLHKVMSNYDVGVYILSTRQPGIRGTAEGIISRLGLGCLEQQGGTIRLVNGRSCRVLQRWVFRYSP